MHITTKSFAILLVTALPAFAQSGDPMATATAADASSFAIGVIPDAETMAPEALSGIPGLTRLADIGGLEAWGDPASGLLWLHDRASETVVAGWAFDEDGVSLNPVHNGLEGMTLDKLVENTLGDAVSIPAEVAPDVEQALSALPAEARQEATNALIASLRDVEGEAAFNEAISKWLKDLPASGGPAAEDVHPPAPPAAEADTEGPAVPPADPAVPTSGSAGVDPDPAASETASETTGETADAPVLPAAPDVANASGETAAPASADDVTPKQVSLHEALQESFELVAGAEGGADVWMVTDPSCGPCKVAFGEIWPEVEAGHIRLHVVPLPAASEDSFGILAGVMRDGDPVAAMLAMSAAGAEPPFARFSSLDEATIAGLRRNQGVALAAELPGLPFFVLSGEAGPAYLHGPTAVADLSAAIRNRSAADAQPAVSGTSD